MISHLYINNYALIKELSLKLDAGFTTITGETGAGKSILLGALGLVLGKRAESKVLADESKKCIVEATFSIQSLNLEAFFKENDLDFEPNTILRREILPSGKSRAFVNDTPVKLDVIKSLAERLIDIHSQHDSILMLNQNYQLELLDQLAQTQKYLSAYQDEFNRYQGLISAKAELEKSLSVEKDLDYIQFLVDELEKSNLAKGEDEKLEGELNQLRHAEEIQHSISASMQKLISEIGALPQLNDAIRELEQASKNWPAGSDLLNRLRSTQIELQDIADELEIQAGDVVLDESKLSEVENRFNLINHLLQKHRLATVDELFERFESLSAELELAKTGAKKLEEIDVQIARQFVMLKDKAVKLHAVRSKYAKSLEAEIKGYLSKLQLEHASISVDISFGDLPQKFGFDHVAFMFTANPGSKPQPIHKIASGGEISRVMLALKAILAKSKSLPAIVFDEIDTGISGETAKQAAQILQEMGKKMQVVAITHLPQIAASGSQQLQVSKSIKNGQTQTQIEMLEKSDRVEAIARLLSGAKVSQSALATATELLN